MSAQLKLQEATLDLNTKILVATKTKKAGRPNIDHLMKRILVKKRGEKKSIIMMVGALSVVVIVAIFLSYS